MSLVEAQGAVTWRMELPKELKGELLTDDFAPVNVEDSYGRRYGGVGGVVGIEGGVVSGVINLESSGVGASDWRPRHEEHYQEV